MKKLDSTVLAAVMDIAQQAGHAILQVYHGAEFDVQTKGDDSPVTAADLAAHAVIAPGLRALFADTPVLSEESAFPDYAVRRGWRQYWLVDPLDGTKEFIQRNGEFTVNIALIEDHVPVLGVVHVPVTGVTYAGLRGLGAFKIDDGVRTPIQPRTMAARAAAGQAVTVVASRSHGGAAVTALIERLSAALGAIETSSMGSSLKLCLVAEGKADLYPRLGPTSEWDTAAAQGVVEAAGGSVLDSSLEPLRYNTKAELLNPHFYVIGDLHYPWRELL